MTHLAINDHHDATALAREHMEHAEALFTAIQVLLERGRLAHARYLARLGTTEAAADFRDQAQALDNLGGTTAEKLEE